MESGQHSTNTSYTHILSIAILKKSNENGQDEGEN